MSNIQELTKFMRQKFVYVSYWGDFDGMNEDPKLVDLLTLQSLVTLAIAEKMKEENGQ